MGYGNLNFRNGFLESAISFVTISLKSFEKNGEGVGRFISKHGIEFVRFPLKSGEGSEGNKKIIIIYSYLLIPPKDCDFTCQYQTNQYENSIMQNQPRMNEKPIKKVN